MEKLFTNYNEFADFANALAYRRIKNLEKANNHFDEEINETIEKCGKIFEEYGSETNYIAEIIDLEMKMQNNDSKLINSVDLEDLSLRRESLYNKYNSFLDKLPLDVKEDLEFYFKKVFDRKLRSNHTIELTNQIKLAYPKAENLTTIEIMDQPIFEAIYDFLNKDRVIAEEEPVLEETTNLPYVTQIKKAPDSLVKEEIVENDFSENVIEPEKESEPNLEIPNLFMNNEELEKDDFDKVMPSFNEIPEQKTDKIEIKEEIEEPKYKDSNVENIFTSFDNLPIVEEEPVLEENKIEIETPSVSEDELTYTMENGDTLTSLAVALCDDENGWYDIFEANKEILEHRLKEAGLSKNDPFENNEEVFVGLTLNIPNVYEKRNQAMKLAA